MVLGRTTLTERDLRHALGRRTILVTGGAGFIGSAVCRLSAMQTPTITMARCSGGTARSETIIESSRPGFF